jgi:antitoxin (DNA-binding transcriptional repressor) of toxin-antitoxin stability system
MKMVNIYEAKAKLSEYLDAVARGEQVVICKRNQPVAELRAVPASRVAPRPIGKAGGPLPVPAAFFDPLPDEIVDGLSGAAEPVRRRSGFRAADAPAEYRVSRGERRRK